MGFYDVFFEAQIAKLGARLAVLEAARDRLCKQLSPLDEESRTLHVLRQKLIDTQGWCEHVDQLLRSDSIKDIDDPTVTELYGELSPGILRIIPEEEAEEPSNERNGEKS